MKAASDGGNHRMQRRTLKYILVNHQLYLMLVFPVLYFVVFKYLPMTGIAMAFLNFDIIAGLWHSQFVGFAHFQEAFGSVDFWHAVGNTLLLNTGDFIIGFPIPIVLAIALNELTAKKVRKAAQVTLFLPYFLSMVIIAGIVFQVFSTEGFVNHLIGLTGTQPVNFLGNPVWWRLIYWGTGVWQNAGYSLIIYLAALSHVNPSLYQAAYIDGAGRMKRIWHITLPMIRSTITVLVILSLGSILQISFERPFLLGNVLVKDAASVISTYVYTIGLLSARHDLATAIGLFQSGIGIILVLIADFFSKKFGEEGII